MTDNEPRDPFLSEPGGPWHKNFREGEMLWLGLAELPSFVAVLVAMEAMSEVDLKKVVLERLHTWHVANGGMVAVEGWLKGV